MTVLLLAVPSGSAYFWVPPGQEVFGHQTPPPDLNWTDGYADVHALPGAGTVNVLLYDVDGDGNDFAMIPDSGNNWVLEWCVDYDIRADAGPLYSQQDTSAGVKLSLSFWEPHLHVWQLKATDSASVFARAPPPPGQSSVRETGWLYVFITDWDYQPTDIYKLELEGWTYDYSHGIWRTAYAKDTYYYHLI